MKFANYLTKMWYDIKRRKRHAEEKAAQKVTQVFPTVTQPAGGPVAGVPV